MFGEQDLAPLVPDFHVFDENGRIDACQDGGLGKADLPVQFRKFDFTLRAGADRLGLQAPGSASYSVMAAAMTSSSSI